MYNIQDSIYSVYLTPKQCIGQQCGEWIEIAYGTNRGMVRIIFQHPETVGQGSYCIFCFHCTNILYCILLYYIVLYCMLLD